MSRSLCLFAAALTYIAVFGFVRPVPADEPPAAESPDEAPIEDRARQWLTDLRSDDFAVREQARKSLKQHGAKLLEQLEAAREHEDPEVRRTVRSILARLGKSVRKPPAPVPPGAFDKLALLHIDVKDKPLGEVLRQIGGQVEGTFKVPESVRALPITLKSEGEPAFVVIERVLALGGLRMQSGFDRSNAATLVLADEDTPVAPHAAAGPLRVEVLEVSATRPLNARSLPRYALKLRIQWVPMVQISQYEAPRVEVARDDKGNAFKTGSSSRRTTYGVSTSMRYATVQVHIEPMSAKCGDKLSVLEIVLPIRRLQHERRRVLLDDIARMPICLGRAGKPVEPGTDESVQFDSLTRADDGRGQWVAELTATLLSKTAQNTVQTALEEEGGGVYPLYVAGGRSRAADGTVRITARAYRPGSAKPKGLQVNWFRREEGGSLRFRLTDVPLR